MSLDKAIASGKERRKPYRKGKAVCGSCRNHGGCPVCEGNRTISRKRVASIPSFIPEEAAHALRVVKWPKL